jgi:5-methylcytosine-specific restriction enzyme A
MSLADLTAEAVYQAIAEFDERGRKAFLAKHGFKPARGYIIAHDGKEYDGKAIAGAAHGYLPGRTPLSAQEFSGGAKVAAGRLRQLGFVVIGPEEQRRPVPTYEPGNIYHRVRDIHEVYDGQRRGGISTPQVAPLIFIFTGESGEQYGYQDGFRDDGIFTYTGEGQLGDMEFVRGNLAVRDHVANCRDLLLFEKLRLTGHYRFVGHFVCDGYEYRRGPDREGTQRRIIVFLLRPALSGDDREVEKIAASLRDISLAELRGRAMEDASAIPARKTGPRSYIERSASVRTYVLKRAAGVCESCGAQAPFHLSNGEPYLEPHHTRRLADGGPDDPRWVGAICPNCHREIHHGEHGRRRNEELMQKVAVIEGRASSMDALRR